MTHGQCFSLVNEKHFTILREWPLLIGDDAFNLIDDDAKVCHGVEDRFVLVAEGGFHLGDGSFEILELVAEFASVAIDSIEALGLGHFVGLEGVAVSAEHLGENHVFRDVESDFAFDVNLLVVVFHVHFVAGIEFAFVEHAVLFEEIDVFLLGEGLQGFHGGADVREPAFCGFFHPFVGVAVAVEDDLLVFLHNLLQQVLQFFVELVSRHALHLVGDDVEGFGNDGVQDDVRFGAALAGTRCAEFELVAGECERRSAVTVGSVAGERRERIGAELEGACLLAGLRIALFELVDDVGKLVAEVHGDDCRRSFVGTETVVVTGASDSHAEQVGVGIDCVNHGAERGEEDGILVWILARIEEVRLSIVHGPVVVLAGTVDASERLFVQQAYESVAFGDLAEHFHDLHVVVAGEVHFFEHRSKFELSRGDFVVAGLGRNTEFPEFLFHIVHEVQDASRNATEVMVFHLLVLCRSCTEQGAPSLVQVRTLEVEALVDEEVFLFGTERDGNLLLRDAEEAHQAVGGFLQSLDGAQERSLLVERFAGIATECSRDAERGAVAMTLDESGGSRVPSRIAAGFECRTQTAAGERRCVRFAHNQVLAAEAHDGLAVFGFQEGVVLFGSGAGQGLEPVSKVRGTAVDGPFLHGMGDLVCNRRVKRCAAFDGCEQLFANVLGEVGTHGFCVEDVLAVEVKACGCCGQGSAGVFCGDSLDCFHSVFVAHGKLLMFLIFRSA